MIQFVSEVCGLFSHLLSLFFSLEEGDKTQGCTLYGLFRRGLWWLFLFFIFFVKVVCRHLGSKSEPGIRQPGLLGFIFQSVLVCARCYWKPETFLYVIIIFFFLGKTEEDIRYYFCSCVKLFVV